MGHKLHERVTLETVIEKLIERRKKIEALTDEVQRLKTENAGLKREKASWLSREGSPQEQGRSGDGPASSGE